MKIAPDEVADPAVSPPGASSAGSAPGFLTFQRATQLGHESSRVDRVLSGVLAEALQERREFATLGGLGFTGQ